MSGVLAVGASLWEAFRMSPLFGPTTTLLAYEAALLVRKKVTASVLCNPVLLAAALVIPLLEATGIPYGEYLANANPLMLMLGPATVALAVPLYCHAVQFRHAALPLCLASLIGAGVGCLGAVAIAAWLGADDLVLRSIAAKSATVAIAVGVSAQIGGIPSLTATLVVCTGILTAIIAKYVLDAARVRDHRARGLAIGVTGHGIGTAYALSVDPEMGAYSGLGMSLAGLAVGLFLPSLWTFPWPSHWLTMVQP